MWMNVIGRPTAAVDRAGARQQRARVGNRRPGEVALARTLGADQERVVGVAVAEVVAELDVGRDHRRARGERVADRRRVPVGDLVDAVEDCQLADQIPLDRQLVMGDDIGHVRDGAGERALVGGANRALVGRRDEPDTTLCGVGIVTSSRASSRSRPASRAALELLVGRLDRALVLERVELEAVGVDVAA